MCVCMYICMDVCKSYKYTHIYICANTILINTTSITELNVCVSIYIYIYICIFIYESVIRLFILPNSEPCVETVSFL